MTSKIRFRGDQSRSESPHKDSPEKAEPYICSAPLRDAVNLAIHLGRPLLLEGEAGCGKTKLARAVAYELGLAFYPWYVNSGTTVKQGLYNFDTIGRLHDVQMRNQNVQTKRNPDKIDDYITYGPLGNAFRNREGRSVVLIDEIDKASVDFPNDLLTTLDDDYKFTIAETGEVIEPADAPIIFITSNREKGDLPEPFLRRCLYYFVEFPNDEALRKIVGAHYRDEKPSNTPSGDLVEKAVSRFNQLRGTTRIKKPGTSEFLDWLEALQTFKNDGPYLPDDLRDDRPVPYPETLFKLKEDRNAHLNQFKGNE